MIRERVPQDDPKHDVLPEEVEVAPAISDSEGSLTDKTSDPRILHRADYVSRPLCPDRAFPARSDRTQYSLLTLHRTLHRSGVHHVASNDLQARVLDVELRGIAGKRG